MLKINFFLLNLFIGLTVELKHKNKFQKLLNKFSLKTISTNS
jgi:hypothetical protein